MSNKLEANESDSLLSAALSDAYRKRDTVDVWDDDALRQFRKDYPRADVVPLAIVESALAAQAQRIALLIESKMRIAMIQSETLARAERAEADLAAARKALLDSVRFISMNGPSAEQELTIAVNCAYKAGISVEEVNAAMQGKP